METPVLANGHCAVLKYQCRQSNGGLYYHTYDEFVLTLQAMLDNASMRAGMGRQGAKFVARNYDWSIILAKYQAVFDVLSIDSS
jgi:glycosyltransferase involved in cell wall biosynthesis